MAESVPPETRPEQDRTLSNGNRKREADVLRRRLERSGLEPIQEILPDPEDPDRAVVILGTGQEPCELELGQLDEHRDFLRVVAEVNPDSRLSERLRMLDEAAGG